MRWYPVPMAKRIVVGSQNVAFASSRAARSVHRPAASEQTASPGSASGVSATESTVKSPGTHWARTSAVMKAGKSDAIARTRTQFMSRPPPPG